MKMICSIQIGEIRLIKFEDMWFLEKPGGEGLEISLHNLETLLTDYYNKNF